MHVLLAEDNKTCQRILELNFRKVGCSFAIVNNGLEALNYLASPSDVCPRPDIILLKISMPIMDGIRVATIIRSQAPFANDPRLRMTPIIAHTANSMPGNRERLMKHGMDDAVSKLIKLSNLKQLLLQYSRHEPVPVGPGYPQMGMAPVWGPMPMRKFHGPRSRL